MGENRTVVRANISWPQRLPRHADRGQELEADGAADVAAHRQDTLAGFVYFDHNVAVTARAGAHLTPAFGSVRQTGRRDAHNRSPGVIVVSPAS